MKYTLFILITYALSPILAQPCCITYPEATTDYNGQTFATINGGEYATFELNDSEMLIYTRKFKFLLWSPGVYKICATVPQKNGNGVCKTCIFYEWDTIDARAPQCINTEWIDTAGAYIVTGGPVCGCDGIEYPDEWRARRHGVTRYAVGPCCFGLAENDTQAMQPKSVTLWPNPTVSDFAVSAYQLEVITIYDRRGGVIQRIECMSDTVTIDTSGLAPGAYFLGIQADGETIIKTLIFVRK